MVMKSLLGSASKCRRTGWSTPTPTVRVAVRWRSKSKKPVIKPVWRPASGNDAFRERMGSSERSDTAALLHLRSGLVGESNELPPGMKTKKLSPGHKQNYELFQQLVNQRFRTVLERMGDFDQVKGEYQPFGINSQAQLEKEISLFKKALDKSFALATDTGAVGRLDNPLFWNLRNAYVKGDLKGLNTELRHAFQTFMMRDRFPDAVSRLHAELADMRFPYEWYPATRQMQRTIHLHVGPTNSGKTYNALKALESANTGIYAGPLRLLAHEIFTRFTAKNLPCALVTGEELRVPKDVDRWFHSCTVEMSPLNQKVDVAVIDEIQMIADDDRGWAWTQAVLGIQAKELHLCGEDRAVGLIQELCARIGDKCVVHRYERLNPLSVMERSLGGDFSKLEKGDAVVSFSRYNLHQLKAGIENQTGRRCAIVYGSLPPETRATQAALFNDPNNDYDFLVASDAIGMGLNLEIKRVVFETSTKFDGMKHRNLTIPEIKQIGGRAGRYKTAAQEVASSTDGDKGFANRAATPGYVTTLDRQDLATIDQGFRSEAPQIETAGIFPPASIIEKFHTFFPTQTPTAFVLSRLRELSRLSPRFHMCDFSTALDIAEAIQPYELSVSDRCVFLSAPVDFRTAPVVDALKAFAQCVAQMGSGHLLDFPELDLEVLEEDNDPNTRTYLPRLEALHKQLALYLWLSYRYEGVFNSQSLAFKVKEMVEDRISEYLEHLSYVAQDHARLRAAKRAMAQKHKRSAEKILGAEEQAAEAATAGTPGEHAEGVGRWEEEGHEEPLFENLEEIKAAKFVRATLAEEAEPQSVASEESREEERKKEQAQG
ncbi:P-loop containing nucleoside triphosphate hydrolase protein [Cladorrhinum sp. PSN332]|nr:P-loop containing nucleoside triphosphate hydrolase protein [Cladorrhinum sp. PSN332]